MKYAWKHKSNKGTERTLLSFGTTLLDLLKEKSFESITIKEICNKANYPRATFYNYFEDKYDLLEFYFEFSLKKAEIHELLRDNATAYEIFNKVYDYLNQYKENIKSILIVNKQDGELVNYLRMYIRKLILGGMKDSDFKNHQIPYEIVAEHYANTLELIIKWSFIVDNPITKDDARKYLKYFLTVY